MEKNENKKPATENSKTSERPKCGIIMPISPIDNCSAEHWLEIMSILKEVANEAGFEPNLVSDSDDIGIIQKRIIQNVYSSDIIICDVSGKNPNVMFELGMRLAFDKATIIVKDDKTDYSFDTGVIEHIGYPRDLRFHKILEFKENLKKKLESTYKTSKSDPNYSTFLKSFGEYKIAHLKEKEVSSENFILNSLEDIRNELRGIKITQRNTITSKRFNENVLDEQSLINHDAVIKKYFDQYLIDNKVSRYKEIPMMKDEIYEYIEKQDEVRMTCGSRRNVESAMKRVIGI